MWGLAVEGSGRFHDGLPSEPCQGKIRFGAACWRYETSQVQYHSVAISTRVGIGLGTCMTLITFVSCHSFPRIRRYHPRSPLTSLPGETLIDITGWLGRTKTVWRMGFSMTHTSTYKIGFLQSTASKDGTRCALLFIRRGWTLPGLTVSFVP